MKRNFLLAISFLLMSVLAFGQQTVTGVVTSAEDGSTLPGVSVVVKGTVMGTTTNPNGEYSIVVPEGYNTLIFSFIGMETKEVEIGNKSIVNVSLEPSVLGLEEVVVTAIGIEREKKALGYSVEEVGGDDLSNTRQVNVVDALQGKVAGVRINRASGDPGASSFIEIRGSASLTRNNQPLFVIDGVPIDNSGNTGNNVAGVAESNRAIDINPDDIESLTVLKGGAATALYGIRAANGAIIITTKSGRNTGGKIEVNFRSSIRVEQANKLPPLQNKFAQGSQDFADLYRFFGLPSSNLAYPDQTRYSAVSWGPSLDTLVYTKDPNFVPANFFPGYGNGQSSMEEYIAKWDPNGRLIGVQDAQRLGVTTTGMAAQAYDPYELFQTGVSSNNYLSISAGNEKSNFFLSYGNNDNQGIVPNARFTRNTAKLAANTVLNEKLRVGGSINYSNSLGNRIQKGSNISGLMLGLMRTPPTFNNAFGYQFPDKSQRSYRGGGGYDNPYWIVNNIRYKDITNRLIGNVNAEYNATEWLSFFYRMGYDGWFKDTKSFFEKNSNSFPDGRLEKSNEYNIDLNSDIFATINKDLNDDMSIRIRVGQNLYQRTYQSTSAIAFGLNQFEFPNMSNTSDARGYESNFRKRTSAWYGDVGFEYQRMLYLNLTGRYEKSTTLPEGNNGFFYPSASASFVFTELPGLADNEFLSFGKFRISYAQIANDAAAYATQNYYFQPSPGDGWTDGLTYPLLGVNAYTLGDVIGNRTLRPENQNSFEVGANLIFMNNKLGLDVTYFYNTSTDLLLSVPVAASSGFGANYVNAGEMFTRGFEVILNATVVNTKDLRWDISANWSNPYSEVTKLAEGVENVFLSGFTEPQVRAVVGFPYRTLFGLDWERDAEGRVLIDDDPNNAIMDGFPFSSPELKPLGNVNPDWIAGITNTLTYKGFSLSALIDIKKGGLMWNGTKGALYFFGTHKDTENRGESKVWEGVYGHIDADGEIAHYETPFDPTTEVKGVGSTNTTDVVVDETWYWWEGEGSGFTGPSSPYVEKAGWVRLRNITLSYQFSPSLLDNGPFRSVELYVTGFNLWLNTPYTGVDPETSLVGSNNGLGIDYFNNPGTKGYTFGLNLGF